MTLDPRAESARGYLLMGIFYVHLLIGFAQTRADASDAVAAFVQIKLLAPHVAIFFFLSGIGARHIGKRAFQPVASQSLMLFLLAATMQVVGYAIGPLWSDPPAGWAEGARRMLKPIVLGTGHATFVAWFFVVLAIVRILAWAMARGWRTGLLTATGFAVIIALGSQFVGSRNLFEWRAVPIALLFFWIGSRIPRDVRIPTWVGLSALALALAVTWIDRPDLLGEGPCLTCDVTFVSQPTIGQYRNAPVYLVQELLFLVFLLWGAQKSIAIGIDSLSRFFGRYSMQTLLLHGLLMAAILPLVVKLFPVHPSVWLFVTMLVGGVAVHAALLRLLRPALDRWLALCFALARSICDLPQRRKLATGTP